MLYKASAPGSLMLLGEYAVLEKKHALVCALDKRISVTITPRQDLTFTIAASLGKLEGSIKDITIKPPFQFVLGSLKKFQTRLWQGCDIVVDSEFSEQIGFGSSAAVTVATIAAIRKWLQLKTEPANLILDARAVIQSIQGIGSGADAAACVLGGIVGYKMQPLWFEKISETFPLTIIYSGKKTPTATAIQHVKNVFEPFPKVFQQLCLSIDYCAFQGIQAVREKNWESLGQIMNLQQGLMQALQVNTPEIDEIILNLKNQNVLGAKISGSGLGDCVIAIGKIIPFSLKHEIIPAEISNQGVVCEQG